jgi:hypothetical protein
MQNSSEGVPTLLLNSSLAFNQLLLHAAGPSAAHPGGKHNSEATICTAWHSTVASGMHNSSKGVLTLLNSSLAFNRLLLHASGPSTAHPGGKHNSSEAVLSPPLILSSLWLTSSSMSWGHHE